MAIIEGRIRKVTIQNQFNNGEVFEIGKPILHCVGNKPKKCKIVDIIEQGGECYYQHLIIVQFEDNKPFMHEKLRNVSVRVEYF